MKLIIDIPEEDYKGICHLKNEQLRMLPVEVAETLLQIANGIPLDKIRAEINAIEISGQIDEHTLFARSADGVKEMALNIIDRYRKEVSE